MYLFIVAMSLIPFCMFLEGCFGVVGGRGKARYGKWNVMQICDGNEPIFIVLLFINDIGIFWGTSLFLS